MQRRGGNRRHTSTVPHDTLQRRLCAPSNRCKTSPTAQRSEQRPVDRRQSSCTPRQARNRSPTSTSRRREDSRLCDGNSHDAPAAASCLNLNVSRLASITRTVHAQRHLVIRSLIQSHALPLNSLPGISLRHFELAMRVDGIGARNFKHAAGACDNDRGLEHLRQRTVMRAKMHAGRLKKKKRRQDRRLEGEYAGGNVRRASCWAVRR